MADSKIDYLLASPGYLPGKVFNSWIGCDKCDEHGNVREGCRHCWAEAWARRSKRFAGHWGRDAPRYFLGESYWRQPLRWQKQCERAGKRMRVLAGAMSDVFERLPFAHRQAARLAEERRRLWDVIADTPMLDWLALTKRPQNMGPGSLSAKPGTLGKHGRPVTRALPNLWLGVSIWDQPSADRNIPLLLEVTAALRWVSYEPALGPVDVSRWMPLTWGRRSDGEWGCDACCTGDRCDEPRHIERRHCHACKGSGAVRRIDWVVAGCESRGPRPGRHCDPSWAKSVAKQCEAAGVPCYVKQLELTAWPGRLLKSKGLAQLFWPTQLPDTRLLGPQRAQKTVSRGGRAASRTGRDPA